MHSHALAERKQIQGRSIRGRSFFGQIHQHFTGSGKHLPGCQGFLGVQGLAFTPFEQIGDSHAQIVGHFLRSLVGDHPPTGFIHRTFQAFSQLANSELDLLRGFDSAEVDIGFEVVGLEASFGEIGINSFDYGWVHDAQRFRPVTFGGKIPFVSFGL